MGANRMATPRTTPEEMRGPSGSGASEQWILKLLNDLRDDIQKTDERVKTDLHKIDSRLGEIETRIGNVESRISKLIWIVTGAALVLGVLFGGFELLTTYFDVNITPKKP